MEEELSREQKDIKKAAREFALGEFPKVAKVYDLKEDFPRDLYKKACEYGFVAVHIKEKHSGPGLGLLETVIILEEFLRVDPGCGNIATAAFGSELIQSNGSEDQKRLLPLIAQGKAITGIAPFSQFECDQRNSKTKILARRNGPDEYLLNGEALVMNGAIADYLILFCLTSKDSELSVESLSLFIMPVRIQGLAISPVSNKLGLRAADFAYIRLRDVRIGKSNIVGDEESGLEYQEKFSTWLKVCNAAQGIGVAQGALDQSIKYARTRVQFGVPIGRFEAIQFKIANMATKIEAARCFCYRAAKQIDSGINNKTLVAMAKSYTTDVCSEVTSEAIQIHGGYGFMKEYDLERFYRDAHCLSVISGRKYFEKKFIAKNLLGISM